MVVRHSSINSTFLGASGSSALEGLPEAVVSLAKRARRPNGSKYMASFVAVPERDTHHSEAAAEKRLVEVCSVLLSVLGIQLTVPSGYVVSTEAACFAAVPV